MSQQEFNFEVPEVAETTEQPVFTVSEITAHLKSLIEGTFPNIWVEGEISTLRRPTSGHLYFTLKDSACQLRGVMFRNAARKLTFNPEDGMAVMCRGRIGLYEVRGEYQLIVDEMEARGVGALLIAFEQLKARLDAEGLFDPRKKKSLPLLPQRLGIVTSPTGAALQDILKVIRRRREATSILICPARVQGQGAAEEIAEGIERLCRRGDVEVIIIGRGGGSLEDLWAFNEEIVARAIAKADIPIVSAVGHEIDLSISDLVADLRAPTPSAAAEMVVPMESELRQRLKERLAASGRAVKNTMESRRRQLIEHKVKLGDPRRLLSTHRLNLDELHHCGQVLLSENLAAHRKEVATLRDSLWRHHPRSKLEHWQRLLQASSFQLDGLIGKALSLHRSQFDTLSGKLGAMSPLAVLQRGYSITRTVPEGKVVKNSDAVNPGEDLEVLLHQGSLRARVSKTAPPDKS